MDAVLSTNVNFNPVVLLVDLIKQELSTAVWTEVHTSKPVSQSKTTKLLKCLNIQILAQ